MEAENRLDLAAQDFDSSEWPVSQPTGVAGMSFGIRVCAIIRGIIDGTVRHVGHDVSGDAPTAVTNEFRRRHGTPGGPDRNH